VTTFSADFSELRPNGTNSIEDVYKHP